MCGGNTAAVRLGWDEMWLVLQKGLENSHSAKAAPNVER